MTARCTICRAGRVLCFVPFTSTEITDRCRRNFPIGIGFERLLTLQPGLVTTLYQMSQVLECELFLILEMMDCFLIVYHPYRPLTQYVADLGIEDAILPIAWRILNDSLRTESDVSLIYPPYQIALAAIYMACVIQQKDCKQWFAELSVDMDKILEITQEILQLYELWKSYDERTDISAILSRAPKPKVRPTSATPGQTPSPVPPES
ncbi:cyclin-C-like [Montipora foliosa]|uniref:cyclin-C-like n=1 Tax=Montipora foliosa TaxID=591990 RepID=UPI0035F1097B